MNDNLAQTESILDIIRDVDKESIMLPEFQRDFRWELDQTYDLFDSLAREIFIGTIIYGKPSFGIACRELDTRPRKGDGSRKKLDIKAFTEDEISQKVQTQNFRVVLDGQQRITCLYRAITAKGRDYVYFVTKLKPGGEDVEAYLESFSGEDRDDRICIKLNDVYNYIVYNFLEEDLWLLFEQTSFAKAHGELWDQNTKREAFRTYIKLVRLIADLFKREKLVAYYLLDMSVEKFCTFFERSNSRGIQLNFTDILAAKLYPTFNLRQKIDDFEADSPDNIKLNRELIVRAVAYFTNVRNETKPQIDKAYILKSLQPSDFKDYWDKSCELYVEALSYLYRNNMILSQQWMPSENMLLPLMVFIAEVGGDIGEDQRRFLEFWFWASTFSGRYSGSSNEVIVEDTQVLKQVARYEHVSNINYLRRLRSRISEPADIYAYQKKANSIYRGILNLVNRAANGMLDWTSQNRLSFNDQELNDHHIFPRGFISSDKFYRNTQAEELVDCVANRALIRKITNLQIAAKPPSKYMAELARRNSQLALCLDSHLISDLLLEPDSDEMFFDIIETRATEIYDLIKEYVEEPVTTFGVFFPAFSVQRVDFDSEKSLPIFAEYRGNEFKARLFPVQEKIELDGRLLSVTTATNEVVASAGGPQRGQNGWNFWKFLNTQGYEMPIKAMKRSSEEWEQ